MGQVPYGIVGDGRLARHIVHYFNLLRIPYHQWSRSVQGERGIAPTETLAGCSTVLLAIRDSAIDPFSKAFLEAAELGVEPLQLVHFSGAHVSAFAAGMHPLMTFNTGFYELADYQKMAFVCEAGGPSFEQVFPDFKNPHYTIRKEDKAFYHALCVMSGSFSVILWQKLFHEFQSRLGIPASAAFPFLERIAKNLQADSGSALTGPLQRKDYQTITKNLESLQGDSFHGIYEAFVSTFTSKGSSP